MVYPQKSDIILAVKHNDKFVLDQVLKGGLVELDKNNQPFMFTGGFSLVFKIKKNYTYAFRVWHAQISDIKNRLTKISDYLSKTTLPYFVEFSFVEKGILVNGQTLPTSRMLWLEGDLLKDYLYKHLNNRKKLKKLTEDFLQMTIELHEHHISHGDLQHGNIIIDKKGELKLIDYDSLYIPEIKGEKEIITGLHGYQHPARFENKMATEKADYFSELIIYLSILALSEEPALWDKYNIHNTEYLLFNENDFLDFDKSQIKKDLLLLSPEITALVKVLEYYLSKKNINELNPFSEVLEALFKDPEILLFKANKTFLENGPDQSVIIYWRTKYANHVGISNIGENLSTEGQQKIKLDKNKIFTLSVRNALNKTKSATLKVEVSKAPPEIIEFSLSKTHLKDKSPSILKWNLTGAKSINISHVGNNLPSKGESKLFFKKDTKIILTATSFFGIRLTKEIELKVSKEPPLIKDFSSNYTYVIPNTEVEFSWNVENAENVIILDPEQNIILKTNNNTGKYVHKVAKTGLFTLKAKTIFGYANQKSIFIESLPIPVIKTLQTDTPNINVTSIIDFTALEVPNTLIDSRNIKVDIPISLEENTLELTCAEINLNTSSINVNTVNVKNFENNVITVKNPEFVLENNLNPEIKFNWKHSLEKITETVKELINKEIK